MSDPFVGEIRAFPYAQFVPVGWLACDGTLYPIPAYTGLFNVLQTRFGGDGRVTFGVPDLRGRIAYGSGNNVIAFPFAGKLGGEATSLQVSQVPPHTHTANVVGPNGSPAITASVAVSNSPATPSQMPAGSVFAQSSNSVVSYAPLGTQPAGSLGGATVNVQGGAANVNIGFAGGGQPFGLMPSYVAVRYGIAYQGIFPTPS